MIVAAQGIRSRPLRSLLVVLTLAVGVLAVIGVYASSSVAEHTVRARAELQSGRAPTYTAILEPTQLGTIVSRTPAPGVAVTSDLPVRLGDGARDRPALQLTSVHGDLRSIRPLNVISGQWLDGQYPSGYAIHLVVNMQAAALITASSPTGLLRVTPPSRAVPVTVVGIVDDGGELPTAYARWEETAGWFPDVSHSAGTLWMHTTLQTVTRITTLAELDTWLPLRAERTDQTEAMSASVNSLRFIFTVIAGVAPVVASVAVLNIGLATVNERVDELALRRALGATRPSLVLLMLTESLILGIVASLTAVLAAIPLLTPAARLLFPELPADQHITFPATGTLLAIATGLIASGLGGLAPALRASAIPISRVMRA